MSICYIQEYQGKMILEGAGKKRAKKRKSTANLNMWWKILDRSCFYSGGASAQSAFNGAEVYHIGRT
jgi:hypothetical protein